MTRVQKPTPPKVCVEGIPLLLRDLEQWVLWRYRPDAEDGWTKMPVQASGQAASSTDPATWIPFKIALVAYQRYPDLFDGIGFVFAAGGGLAGIDLDHVIDDQGELLGWAAEVLDQLGGYAEVSPSGRGIKAIVRGSILAEYGNRSPELAEGGHVEVYDHARFFTVTGHVWGETGSLGVDASACLHDLQRRYCPLRVQPARRVPAQNLAPLDLSDEQLLARIYTSKSAAAIRSLWNGDTSAHDSDDSRADLALAAHLMWWTGNDLARADQMFRRSGLMRPKWDSPRGAETYGQRTLKKAAAADGGYCPASQQNGQKRKSGTTPGVNGTVPTDPATQEVPPPVPVCAADLLTMTFSEAPCVVAGLTPIGLTLLAGRPKQGKSFLALQMSLAVILGRDVLGKTVVPGDVLYLALEDHQRRIHGRLKHLLGPEPPYPEEVRRLSFLFSEVRPGDLRPVLTWIKAVEKPRLIIIDTLGRFLPVNKRREISGDTYQMDYAWMSELKGVADEAKVGMILVHHTRKVVADDPLTEVSGSTAYTGAADAVLVLRRHRGAQDASLTVTGRDFDEASLNVQWQNGLWALGGSGHTISQKTPGPAPEKTLAAAAWLRDLLLSGPRKVHDLRTLAERHLPEAISPGTLYNAARQVLRVEEYLEDGRKWWRLPDAQADEEEPD